METAGRNWYIGRALGLSRVTFGCSVTKQSRVGKNTMNESHGVTSGSLCLLVTHHNVKWGMMP